MKQQCIRLLLDLLTTIAISSPVFSQQKRNTLVKYSDSGKIRAISFSKFDKSIEIPKTESDFFIKFLHIKENDTFIENTKIIMDKRHQHFEQYYKGILVSDAGYTFHYDKDGTMKYAHGNYLEVPEMDVTPLINKEKASAYFANYLCIDKEKRDGYTADLMIRTVKNGNIKLVYRILLDSACKENKLIGYVDAHTGNIVDTEENTIGSYETGTFYTRYHGTKYATTLHEGSIYTLYDNSRNAIIETKNSQGFTWDTNSIGINDNDNYWYYSTFSNREDMALDVFWALQKIYDRLYYFHGKNSYDNNGGKITAYINALIDNTTNQAAWMPYSRMMAFGRGDNYPRAFSSMDIVAHEFGHGITEYQIGWTLSLRFLNEGMSDIWGMIMDYRFSENDTNVWKMGENVFNVGTYNCARDISNPSNTHAMYPMTDTYLSTSYYNNSYDDYFISGVFSHWFFLLVNGGIGYNENGDFYSFQGVGMDIAENLIVKAVFDGYLRYQYSYPNVCEGFIEAAEDLNINGLTDAVQNAWYAVGVCNQGSEMLPTIIGPTHPVDSTEYHISWFPSGPGYSVQWNFQDPQSSVASLISYDESNSSVCTIDNSSHAYFNDTLEATIYKDGQYALTIKKEIRTGANFEADMVNQFTNPPIYGNKVWFVYDNDTINILDNGTIVITSTSFVSATISHSGSGLSNWSHSGNTVQFSVTRSRWSNQLVTISGYKDYEHFRFFILIPQIPFIIEPLFSYNDGNINISLLDYDELSECEAATPYTDIANKGQAVKITITNTTTGQTYYEDEMENKTLSVNTATWMTGVYVVRLSVGDDVYTKKISVK